MAYIPSHQELRDHPKVKRLARLLDVSQVTAIGHLHALWWWAMDYAEDGDVSRFDEFDLADAAMWVGEPTVFVKALQQCGPGGTHGFLDDDSLHDWEEYGGKLATKLRKDRERKQAKRQATSEGPEPDNEPMSDAAEPDVPRTSDGSPTHVRGTAQVEERRGEKNTPPSEVAAEPPPTPAPQDLDVGIPTTKMDGQPTYAATVAGWAGRHDRAAPRTTKRAPKYRWVLDVIGVEMADGPQRRGCIRQVICEYLTEMYDRPPNSSEIQILGVLIKSYPAGEVFDALVESVERGVGIDPTPGHGDKGLVLYTRGVLNGRAAA